jgi:hypothetical protein
MYKFGQKGLYKAKNTKKVLSRGIITYIMWLENKK